MTFEQTTFENVRIYDEIDYWEEPLTIDVFVSVNQYIHFEYAEVTIKDTVSGIEYRFLKDEIHINDDEPDNPVVSIDKKMFNRPNDKYSVTVRLLNDKEYQDDETF